MTRTWQLLAMLGALLAVDVWVHAGDRAVEALPLIGGFSVSDIDEIAITSIRGTVRIARGDDGWNVTEPYAHDADDGLIHGILAILSKGVRPDARVDDGDHERYGLVAGEHVLVELSGVGLVVSSMYVGGHAGGGVSFVRIPGDDAVYRARIGGRSRYDRPAGSWRNLQIFSFQPAGVVAISIESEGSSLELTRGPDGWYADDLDGELIAALPERLGNLRAQRVMAAGSMPMDGHVTLTMDSGPPVTFEFGAEGEIGAIQREADGPLYQVPALLTKLLADGRDAFADRVLLRIDLDSITNLVLEEAERTSIIRRDPRTEVWIAVQPATVDIDSRRAMDVARYLSIFRVLDFAEISPAAAGFPGELRMRMGEAVLEFGGDGPTRDGQATRYVRVADNPRRIGFIDARVPTALQSAWAR